MTMDFKSFSEINQARCARWHPGFPNDNLWNGGDWSNAMQGEAGEAGNIVKKLRRAEIACMGKNDPDVQALRRKLADEIGDTYAYLDLLATYYDIDIEDAIADKFNAVSIREGFPERV